MSKIVVIGANHAGTAAINTILDNYGKDNEVVVFDRNSNISFLGCGMALWIGDQINGSDGLFYSNQNILGDKGAKIHMETEVTSIDYDKKVVYAKNKNNESFEQAYDRLILATGSLPISPKIDGMDLDNVQFVKLFQNAQEVIDKLHDDQSIKKVSVVGAGYIGVELAEAFQRKGKEVTLIDLAKTSLNNYYDAEFSDEMNQNLEAHGINVRFDEKVQKLVGTNKVEKIVTDKGEYETDMVIMAIGFTPNSGLAQGHLECMDNQAILVDSHQRTSDPAVFAIGDCASIYDNASRSNQYIALATNAVRSGIVAAHNVCDVALESAGVQGSNGIKIYDLCMVSTGLPLHKAKAMGFDAISTDFSDLQKPAFIEDDNENVRIKIIYDQATRRILGAQLASHYDISMNIHMFSLAIQEGLTIDKLKLLDIFFLPHYNQPYNYITMAALSAK